MKNNSNYKKNSNFIHTGQDLNTYVINESIEIVPPVDFPTKHGEFKLYGFYQKAIDKLHTAVVKGNPSGKSAVPVRVHSECHTGDVFGSKRCDCGEQLDAALQYIANQECGIVIYLKQEGRGIGLRNKLKAYALQDSGWDTVEANEQLGFPAETRTYQVGAEIINWFGIKSIILLTNNPDKITKLKNDGINIESRKPLIVSPNTHSLRYLNTKKQKMGHLF